MERIGIYGGTYNPPHIGHTAAARYALKSLGLSKLLMIPSCISPHKQLPKDSPSPRQRMEMLRLAVGDGDITVSDLELQRGSTSYTYETVETVAGQYPGAEILLFMGTDMFLSFDAWRHPERILAKASLAVFYRGDRGEQESIQKKTEEFQKQGAKVYLVENPVTDISSTDLRRLLVFGCGGSYLDPGVGEYIRQNRLYGTGRDYKKLPIGQLEEVVVSLVNPNRAAHVLGCRQTAEELARIHGADITDAGRAALLHDITKALDGQLQLTLCREYGIKLNDFSTQNPKTLHALTGSLVARRIFGENSAVVAAIASHTTGKANMNTLEKIIYVADYMEPNRCFEGVEQLRHLAYTDLDGALQYGLEMTITMLKQQGREISPESQQAIDFLAKKE